MIDKTLQFQLVVSKTVATYFPNGVRPRKGDFGFSRAFIANSVVITPSANALGSGLKCAGE
jgi:hypothetical protein